MYPRKMYFSTSIFIVFLSCSLSTSYTEHEVKGEYKTPRRNSGNVDKLLLSLKSSPTNTSAQSIRLKGRKEDFPETVETLFIPEDPNRYADMLSYVRTLLEKSTSTFDHELPEESGNSANKGNQSQESEDEGDDDSKWQLSEESKNDNKNKALAETLRNTENIFLAEEAIQERRSNSSSIDISENEEPHVLKDSMRILLKKTTEAYDDNRETPESSIKAIKDENGEDEPKVMPGDGDLLEAANYGLQAMRALYYVKEPTLYSMGLYLDTDNPARFVAAFNDQTEEARALSKYGFAVLESTTMFMKKFPDISKELLLSRRNLRNPLREHCPSRGIPDCPPASLKYRTSDGSCNNLENLWWGSAMSTMQRFLPPVYQDHIQTVRKSKTGRPLPSARHVSNTIHEDNDIPLASITLMLMQWGQFVDHDVTATGQNRGFNGTIPQCCLNGGAGFQSPEFMHPECLPIPVNFQDSFYGPLGVRCLEFLRSGTAPREDCEFGPREQLSQVTSYLDASTVYSSNAFQSDTLRLFRNGLLQYGKLQSQKPLLPRQDADLCKLGSLSTSCFRAGDGRLSEQPALTSLHVAFLRLHNRIATKLAGLNFHWGDEKIFQETRKIVGAIVQHITYREFLPIVLGQEVMEIFDLEILKKGYYEGYDPEVNPTIANGFSTAAYRFGHSLVQRSFVRFDSHHKPILNNVSIHDEFTNPANLQTPGSVDRLLLGLINQPSQRRDEFMSKELTNHLFQTPRFRFGMDLASLNIQRGRDHGIPPYTQWREPCGLSPIRSFEDLNRVMPSSTATKFRMVYSSVEDIDLFPAGLAENSVSGGLVGPTFACIIGQQFSNLRRGDRFWYENSGGESSFTPGQLQQIRRVTLAQILCATMDDIETIQPFVFLTEDTLRNQRVSCDSPRIGQIDLEFWGQRPPESKNRVEIAEKANRDSATQFEHNFPSTPREQDEAADGADSKEQQKFAFRRQKPAKASIYQQNRIVVKRPLGSADNVTVVVQNNAVNVPVFVNDGRYESHIRIDPASRYPTSTYRPIYGPVDHRPIDQGQNTGRPISVFPGYNPPKPIPTAIPTLSGSKSTRPYVPHSFDDPNNPNPPNQGFQSAYYPSNDVVFDNLSLTSPRPTLYTYYTSYQQRPTTRKPQHQQMDGYSINHVSQHHAPSYVPVKPASDSWTNLESNHHLPSQSFSNPIYGTNIGNLQSQNDGGSEHNNWQKLQHQYKKPIHEQQNLGNWNSQRYESKPHNSPVGQSYQQNDSGNWNAQNSQYNRLGNKPHGYDDHNLSKHPNINPIKQNDYSTWSSVSSYRPGSVDKVDDTRVSEVPSRPFYQVRPNKRPVEADPDGWSTIPSIQDGPGKPSSYHDIENWANVPVYQSGLNDKPSTSNAPYSMYQKRPTVRPVVLQNDLPQFTSTPAYQQSTGSSAQSNYHDASYNSKSQQKRPDQDQDTLDALKSAFYQRPNRPSDENDNRGQTYLFSSTERPVTQDNGFDNGQIYTKPANRPPSYTHIDKPSDNSFYQTTTRPEHSGLELPPYNIGGKPNSKPLKIHSVTIVTESTETVSPSSYQTHRIQNRVTSEVPKPLISQSNKNDRLGGKRPGQYYYEKNILHRYPDTIEEVAPADNYQLMKMAVEQRHKTISDDDSALQSVIADSKSDCIINNKTNSGMSQNDKNLRTQSIMDDNCSGIKDSHVDVRLEEAFSEEIETTAPLDRRNYWLKTQEDSRLPVNLEMPRIINEEATTAKELPKPIKFRTHAF